MFFSQPEAQYVWYLHFTFLIKILDTVVSKYYCAKNDNMINNKYLTHFIGLAHLPMFQKLLKFVGMF